MNNKFFNNILEINERGWVGCERIWKDNMSSSYPTQPHSLIAKILIGHPYERGL